MDDNERTLHDNIEKGIHDALSTAGFVPTGYIGAATYMNSEGKSMFVTFSNKEASVTANLGLAETLRLEHERQVKKNLER